MTAKTSIATVLALTAGIALAANSAGQLNPTELQQGRLYLQQTRNYVIGATRGLSEAQWKFKPAPERWSIAEIVEHIVVVQDYVLGPVREQLAHSPVSPVARNYQQIDRLILSAMPDRLTTFQAPEPIQPAARWTHAEALDRLLKNYSRLSEYLESTPDLRLHIADSLPMKALSKGEYTSMDGYQWVLAAAGHAERHTKQILEVKADPDFPGK